jgi:hypothetical protein
MKNRPGDFPRLDLDHGGMSGFCYCNPSLPAVFSQTLLNYSAFISKQLITCPQQ